MMKAILLAFIINVCSQNIILTETFKSPSNFDTIKNYLQAKQKALQENATKEDVAKLLVFYSDSLYYEHVLSPEKKFMFIGKADLRNGYISHLGETRNVIIQLTNSIEKQNIIIAEYSIKREIISTGKIENNKVVTIFELDDNGKIKRMTDYL